MKFFCLLFLLLFSLQIFSQKDSLKLGDYYADDQLYASITYSQLSNQPKGISKSNFSYSLSAGFIKDFILNTSGTISVAAGVGYGYDFFNHKLKVENLPNATTVFSSDNTISNNIFTSHNLELPLEIRWRTSTANKYSFWRVYTGIKFLYNFSNTFSYTDANNANFRFTNINAFNKWQYGLTLSAGYDEFNIHVFYGLSPIFKEATLQSQSIETSILKFGLVFYFL
ncbi:porin family protein [Polaribacter tangerinus]|uniref:porin family protein n=1 Tax=Polaribacter tangerinus TaxID=1920034 RepID=UPI000B4B85DD|nr:porin family protein [Polaribacter tangerinus]